MPDKPLTIATYAAGASLAAITLVYVFGPTFFLDEGQSSSSRKKGVVGLSNPANDCFINSILQALAGLGDLRLYLIREVHRRGLDGPDVYRLGGVEGHEGDDGRDPMDGGHANGESGSAAAWKTEGLRQGLVTQALKEVLDRLNERPIYRKTISARSFVAAMERAFRTRISRQQQDAHEFLQIVAERLCEEYHAGRKARQIARGLHGKATGPSPPTITADPAVEDSSERQIRSSLRESGVSSEKIPGADRAVEQEKMGVEHGAEDEDGFPFEGALESHIECTSCGFKPRPSLSTFVTLTLHVPQKSSTSLSSCFDGIFRVEHIEDFRCDKCRLDHALQLKRKSLSHTADAAQRVALVADISAIERALVADPEQPPEDAHLPPVSDAPRRRIARHMRLSSFPRILVVHLSRSIYSTASLSTKNMAKVSFPEHLPLGGLSARSQRRRYRLAGLVTHKGGHNSGHYESFRRQRGPGPAPTPFSTPASFGLDGVYSRQGSPNPSPSPSPNLSTRASGVDLAAARGMGTPPSGAADDSGASSVRSPGSLLSPSSPAPSIAGLGTAVGTETRARAPTSAGGASNDKGPNRGGSFRRRSGKHHRWWRISDDRIREARTGEVLAMQREVYLLFYELEEGEKG